MPSMPVNQCGVFSGTMTTSPFATRRDVPLPARAAKRLVDGERFHHAVQIEQQAGRAAQQAAGERDGLPRALARWPGLAIQASTIERAVPNVPDPEARSSPRDGNACRGAYPVFKILSAKLPPPAVSCEK